MNYDCQICGYPAAHQICTPCSNAYERGMKLRQVKLIINKKKKIDIYSIKYNMGKYITSMGSLPDVIEMNTPTYTDYCAINNKLPTRPPYEHGDSLTTVKGVPIVLVNDYGYGYIFRDSSFGRYVP